MSPIQTSKTYQHKQSAHCESGVASNMLSYYGCEISEPMAFGLSASLAFAYIPFVKLSGMPLIAYRKPPKSIFKGLQKAIGLKMHYQKFANEEKGMQALDDALAEGHVVGLQTSVYWLPYMPEGMRFHFNAHNLLVYGKEGNDYLISDPVFEDVCRCPAEDLKKARFAKGALAAKGLMYYPTYVPDKIDYNALIKKVLIKNYRIMNQKLLPVIGIKGIRYLGNNIIKLAQQPDKRKYLDLYLSHIVRMQEEIGTGGAGFRFIYASFLQELGQKTDNETLIESAKLMTDAGDEWRMFALNAAKMAKGRKPLDAQKLNAITNQCADKENLAWLKIKTLFA